MKFWTTTVGQLCTIYFVHSSEPPTVIEAEAADEQLGPWHGSEDRPVSSHNGTAAVVHVVPGRRKVVGHGGANLIISCFKLDQAGF